MVHELFRLFTWAGSEWVLVILMALSVLVLGVVLQRWVELRRLTKQSARFWKGAGESWIQGNFPAAWQKEVPTLSHTYPSLEMDALQVISQAKAHPNAEPDRVVDAYLQNRRLKLEKNIGILGTIGANAAFVGLLGTVLGIIRAFNDMSLKGLGAGVETIGGGIAEALVATAVGLFVAIPAVIFFNLLNRRISTLMRKAENVAGLALGHSLND
jgi:biopolymer transport protein ExbB/TolQ